eukprot:4079615-Amphidinium_carterae.2
MCHKSQVVTGGQLAEERNNLKGHDNSHKTVQHGSLEQDGPAGNAADKQRELLDQHVRDGTSWLQAGLEDFFVLMRSLRPQQDLMHALLDLSDNKYDAEQFLRVQSGCPRSYRIVDLHKGCEVGGIFYQFLQAVAGQVNNKEAWGPMVVHERGLCDSFRYSLRSLATAFELLVVRCRGYPAKLFRLLESPGLAAHIAAQWEESPCLFDPFSAKHLSLYPSEAELLSLDSLKTLESVAQLLVGNIHSVETGHTKNSRRSRQRQTRHMSLEHLAMWHAVHAAPAFAPQQEVLQCADSSGKC